MRRRKVQSEETEPEELICRLQPASPQDRNEKPKSHHGCYDKTSNADDGDAVKQWGGLGEYNQGGSDNQGRNDYGEGNAVADLIVRSQDGIQSPVLEPDSYLALFYLFEDFTKLTRNLLRQPHYIRARLQ